MSEKYFSAIRLYLKDNILNHNTFFGHDHEWNQVFCLMQRTVECGESNSAILIGPRGSGKSALVGSVLTELKKRKNFDKDSILVKLHGIIHTEDRLALRSITTQMNLDNAVNGKVFGSFAENLTYLLACLRTGERHTTKSVIFILEEMDLFCAHHNQTLLYNLFDISQSAQTPLCILGVTNRLDVIELLEKRVKSRFSHRQFFMFSYEGDNKEFHLDHILKRINYYLCLSDTCNLKINTTVKKQWNTNLKTLLEEKKIKNAIQRLVHLNLDEKTMKNILLKIVSQLKEEHLFVDVFEEELYSFEKDDMIQVLQDLNVLELCLVISMKHHVEIYNNQPMNFEMILTRYIKFSSANSNIQSIQRPVIMKAFEHIQNLEIIAMINSGTTRVQKEYQFFRMLVTPRQISETVKKSVGLPTEVVQWSNSSLV